MMSQADLSRMSMAASCVRRVRTRGHTRRRLADNGDRLLSSIWARQLDITMYTEKA